MAIGYDPKGPIFISYRQSDGKPYAELLDNYPRAGGLVPWRDLVDLPPGETKQRVEEAFGEGISNAILVVTEELRDSEFVPKIELPRLLELDAERDAARPFHLLVLNTQEKASRAGEIDVDAPDALLRAKGHWPPPGCEKDAPLRDLKQYALLPTRGELRQLYADLLDARLSARTKELDDKEVTIQTQTRPAGTSRSRLSGVNRSLFVAKNADDPYDLTVRLRQDPTTGVPSELAMVSLQQTLPLLVDGLHAHGVEKVRISAAGHASLLWAIGAALPTTRMRPGSVVAVDIDEKGTEWHERPVDDSVDREQFRVEWDCWKSEVPHDRLGRAVVLLQVEDKANVKAFERLADSLPEYHAKVVVRLRGSADSRGIIDSSEGGRLANTIMNGLRALVNDVGITEFHIANQLPATLSTLLGRNSNTLNIVLYEWGSGGRDGHREYVRMARLQPGMPGGPITEVFSRRRPRKTGEITEFVNLTPHAMNLIQEGLCVKSWDAASEDDWCRLEEEIVDVDPLAHEDIEVPVALVTEGDVANHPPQRDGVGYIVPRLTATGSNRDDFFFPIRQTRDEERRISGGQEIEHLLSTASQKVTRAALKARRGELWMLHAGAVADEQGRVVVVIGPSGRGKTTATRTLAQRYAYVSDETVAIDSDGIVHPYRKPLSIIEDEQRVKAQRPPSELGLGALPAVPLRLAALVLLDRRPDGPDEAVIEDCNVGDVLDEVVQQTSHFADLPHPLRTLAAHAEAVGGFRRAIYREAEALADAFAPLFRDPATNVIAEEHVALAPPSRSGAAEGWQRTPYLDALALTDPSRIAIVQSGEAGGLLRIIDGIGPVLWQHADGRPLAELVSAVVAAHGEPGSDDAAQLVDAAIAELAEQGLLTSAAETGFDPTETRYQAGAS